MDVLKDLPLRKQLLTMIFCVIIDCASNKNNTPIRKLTIINLQNCPIPDSLPQIYSAT